MQVGTITIDYTPILFSKGMAKVSITFCSCNADAVQEMASITMFSLYTNKKKIKKIKIDF